MKKKKLNWLGISWITLVLMATIFYFVTVNFIVFPDKYKFPFTIILVLILVILGFFSLKRVNGNTHFSNKNWKSILFIFINCFLSISLLGMSIYLPILETKMKGLFVEPSDSQEIRMNVYVMSSEYREANKDSFGQKEEPQTLEDCSNLKFITQNQIDQDNESFALQEIQQKIGLSKLNIVTTADLWGALASLYDGSGDVLVMNESFENTVSEVAGYENFSKDTKVLYTVVKTIEVEKTEKVQQSYTNSPFMVFFAGSDSRSSALSLYTRTDVDMLLTVDPIHKQILVVSMPRDWYVKNPALGNGYDKLTHLGNNGLQNTMDGLNAEFGFDYIKDYFELNFVTFYNIVEGLGGIDIDNPYAFTAESADDVDGTMYGGIYSYEQGMIHLNGNEALSYVRERYNLPDGDYGRNTHQTIVIQAIINKLASKDLISNYGNVLEKLQGNFLSSISSEDIYSLAEMQLNDGGSWNFISYHLGGIGASDVTASMGSQLLYVSYPIDSQVAFAKEQMEKVMRGEIITQETLPDDNQTTYIPN